MKQWNGVFQGYRYTCPDGLLIDENGCIWFRDAVGKLCIWCIPSRLRYHLHRLWNVTRGAAVENVSYIARTGRNW